MNHFMSNNFTMEEMIRSNTAIKHNIINEPNKTEQLSLLRLIQGILQPIRDRLGKPITITSGFRCKKLNELVGGSKTSQHVKGEAVDIKCYDNKKLFNLIKSMMDEGIIEVGQLIDEYDYSWIHISLPTLKKNNQILHIRK